MAASRDVIEIGHFQAVFPGFSPVIIASSRALVCLVSLSCFFLVFTRPPTYPPPARVRPPSHTNTHQHTSTHIDTAVLGANGEKEERAVPEKAAALLESPGDAIAGFRFTLASICFRFDLL